MDVLKKIMLGLLLTMGAAQADVLYLDNGFVVTTEKENTLYQGEDLFWGYSTVTLTNQSGLFSIYEYFPVQSFYEFDPVHIAAYGPNGLIKNYDLHNTWGMDPIWFPYFSAVISDISYLTITPGTYSFRAKLPTLVTAAVPEPSQWALLLLGVVAMLGLSRRRRGMGMALPA